MCSVSVPGRAAGQMKENVVKATTMMPITMMVDYLFISMLSACITKY